MENKDARFFLLMSADWQEVESKVSTDMKTQRSMDETPPLTKLNEGFWFTVLDCLSMWKRF